MRCSFPYSLKQTATAAVLSCCIAGGVGVVTTTSATERAPVSVSVNRINKGDRLPQSPVVSQYPNGGTSAGTAASPTKKAPFGCDPAFSPISAPKLAHIFKRCVA